MSDWHIPLSDIDYGAEEQAAVDRVLRSKWLSMGPETKSFEEEFATFVGTKHAIAVANGTAALHLAFVALEIGPGDEVIQPAINFVASANMTMAVGATPVFADIIALEEPTIDPAAVERLITPRTKAVLVMHYGGYPCRMDALLEIARNNNIAIVEDACHAIGAEVEVASARGARTKQQCGAVGDVGCFSFFSNKNLATGEGGMLTTNRDDLTARIRSYRSHGMTSLTWDRHRGHASTYDVAVNGYNYRMDDLRAALGREQLRKIESNNERRRVLTNTYWRELIDMEKSGWRLPFRGGFSSAFGEDCKRPLSAGHLMVAVAPDEHARLHAATRLRGSRVQTSLHYPPVTGFSAFERSACAKLPVSLRYGNTVLTLPLFPSMTSQQVLSVTSVLRCA
ncbi:MAG TPA: DegT/DnrJ/EryC1/StrS family aminotransferase [Chthoniobacterales bacterium]|nr:DegT/DnrJ/EryC1/StrS family aminotransferase [Chthoniobacterales bacterium]